MAIEEVRSIPLSQLEMGKAQARLRDTGKDIDELAESIKKLGLLEPIVVARTEAPDRFEILTGQRRFLAHQRLGKQEILCAILEGVVDEAEAKAISLVENLIRRDLNRLDLIDASTWLFKRYGTIKAVSDATGIPYSRVAEYVKYDRLLPELKKLVDSSDVPLKKALRAQDAAAARTNGDPDPDEAVKLAREMSGMSDLQARRIIRSAAKQPESSTDDLIEEAKTGGRLTQIIVTLSGTTHALLQRFAADEGSTQDDAAAQLIEEALNGKGYS